MLPPRNYETDPFKMDKRHGYQYKYVLDIDGNSVSWTRLPYIMVGGSVPLKPDSEFSQWFYGAIKPYRHYVPVKDDMSDLVEQVQWLRQNDHIAREI